jgi:hypothetical protein
MPAPVPLGSGFDVALPRKPTRAKTIFDALKTKRAGAASSRRGLLVAGIAIRNGSRPAIRARLTKELSLCIKPNGYLTIRLYTDVA